MPNIPEFPKEGVKNHFFGLTLASMVLVGTALIYRPSYLPATFAIFVTFLFMFVINIFFVKVKYGSNVRNANRTAEFVLIAIIAILGLLITANFGWNA